MRKEVWGRRRLQRPSVSSPNLCTYITSMSTPKVIRTWGFILRLNHHNMYTLRTLAIFAMSNGDLVEELGTHYNGLLQTIWQYMLADPRTTDTVKTQKKTKQAESDQTKQAELATNIYTNTTLQIWLWIEACMWWLCSITVLVWTVDVSTRTLLTVGMLLVQESSIRHTHPEKWEQPATKEEQSVWQHHMRNTMSPHFQFLPTSAIHNWLKTMCRDLIVCSHSTVVARYRDKMRIKLTAITSYHGSQGSHM